MELILIRHGQSQAEIEERHEGRADFSLTPKGRRQALRAAQYIYQHFPLQKIIASPLLRSQETAQIIARHLDLNVEFDNRLLDIDNGKLEGMLRTEALEKYPYPTGGRRIYHPIHGGESELEFRTRVEHFFLELLDNHPPNWVGIVTHASTISMLFRAFLELPLNSKVHLSTGDTGIHYWHLTDKFRQILFNNHLGHLAGLDEPT